MVLFSPVPLCLCFYGEIASGRRTCSLWGGINGFSVVGCRFSVKRDLDSFVGGNMKTFHTIICLLMFFFTYQIVYAQQAPTAGFVDLEMPLEEALTKITFIVTRLSGEGSNEVVSSEVVFEGEGVIREKDYIELRIPHDFGDRVAYSSYTLFSKYALESNQYIFVPLAESGGGSGVFWDLNVVDKKTLKSVDSVGLGDRARFKGIILADAASNTVSIRYIGREVRKSEIIHDPDKTIQKHFRMIEGKLREVEDPLSPSDPDMMFIPAGDFDMGSRSSDNDAENDEKPRHTVYLDAFHIDKYEVTNAQYKKFVDANPQWQKDRIPEKYHDGDYLKHWNGNNYPPGKGNHPVVYVSWYTAMAYAEWHGKRLPTEAEWEKAARGGRHPIKYTWGSFPDLNKANYGGKIGDTTPVGTYETNGYGLYDMAGNVWEWCLDEYDAGFYYISPYRNPVAGGTVDSILSDWTNVKNVRVLRGGSWVSDVQFMVVSDRTRFTPRITSNARGFRCVKDVKP
ncbi:formylglycine-generating enzyme family protein [Candidatus Poribacteria bacterium]|nr:formylglycine-generating enzyme family protein [Candidatus Poribacteria bacterium]